MTNRRQRAAKGSPVPAKAPGRRRYLIQIDRPGESFDMQRVLRLFEGTGIEIDRGYGPVPVNPAKGRFVVRGMGTAASRKQAEGIPGVLFFSEPAIEPTD
ncbi:MAG TPA: hypothetical protein VNM87_03015 [Candidatus Udaeobacter sp.]|nr:hypothetical protein [Candidatus Udaeobacter sp.]